MLALEAHRFEVRGRQLLSEGLAIALALRELVSTLPAALGVDLAVVPIARRADVDHQVCRCSSDHDLLPGWQLSSSDHSVTISIGGSLFSPNMLTTNGVAAFIRSSLL